MVQMFPRVPWRNWRKQLPSTSQHINNWWGCQKSEETDMDNCWITVKGVADVGVSFDPWLAIFSKVLTMRCEQQSLSHICQNCWSSNEWPFLRSCWLKPFRLSQSRSAQTVHYWEWNMSVWIWCQNWGPIIPVGAFQKAKTEKSFIRFDQIWRVYSLFSSITMS